ncbi:branched-chain amino acid ABC transporter permease [Paracholeplasma manati]|uniref:Branched-chain amino acid ABC transporter permease n=1 Tax=Paracholeplasma manati TaxID=591373 RepID=A0ABT2Y6F7_9MOLU|nr:branched-chain amino acid ABC transporter permease [Paracholeplasma manati]MCV2232315.1 branched-chain amino acid ABC transporter permease [Paracholeplasma manati]MDG0888272.1 branched-chain amino acid ABC transporter permease [Paracholeplasma manati]
MQNTLKNLKNSPLFGIFIFTIAIVLVRLLGNAGLFKQSTIDFISIVWIYTIVGLGYSLLLGYTGLASLGTAAFIGLGTYIVSFAVGSAGLPLVVAFIIGIAVAIVFGTLVGFISLRIEGMYLAIITLGLAEIMIEIFRKARNITGGDGGFRFEQFNLFGFTEGANALMYRNIVYFIVVAVLVVSMILFINIVNSPTGRAMLSIKNSTSAAQAMGISVLKYRLLAFVLATIMAVIGGMLYMPYFEYTEPGIFNLAISLNILAAVIVGGSKSIWGVTLGTFVIFGLKDIVLKQIPFFRDNGNAVYFFTGALVILIVMYYPGGLVKLFGDLKIKAQGWIKTWKAKGGKA